MKETFRGYYTPTESEFQEMWKTCTFAFDANALLNVYRYTPETCERFLSILTKLETRIWMPHQAALEYQENRLTVISQQAGLYDKIEDELNKSQDNIINLLDQHKRHPLIDVDDMNKTMANALDKVKTKVAQAREQHPQLLETDNLREQITNLFARRVGAPYIDDEYQKRSKEAEIRLAGKIPPGYKDLDKPEPSKKIGDALIWLQLLDFAAKEPKKPLILVNDDLKEDWWLIHKGRTIGPRPELVQEMAKLGVAFYMYPNDRFMQFAQGFLKMADQPKAVEEASAVREQAEHLARRQMVLSDILTAPGDVQKSLLMRPIVNFFQRQYKFKEVVWKSERSGYDVRGVLPDGGNVGIQVINLYNYNEPAEAKILQGASRLREVGGDYRALIICLALGDGSRRASWLADRVHELLPPEMAVIISVGTVTALGPDDAPQYVEFARIVTGAASKVTF